MRDSTYILFRKEYYELAQSLKEEERLVFYEWLALTILIDTDDWVAPKECPESLKPTLNLVAKLMECDSKNAHSVHY